MNKLFTKIAGLTVGLTMAIGVGVAVGGKEANRVEATDVDVSWTASSGALGSAIDSVNGTAKGKISTGTYEWDYTRTLTKLATNKNDYVAMSNGYLQCGSGNATNKLEFETTNIPGTIKSVTVNCGSKEGHKITIKVGTTYYLNDVNAPSWSNNSGADKTGTGTSSGKIYISLSRSTSSSNSPVYIKSITVTYDAGTEVTITGSGTVEEGTPVTYSCDNGVTATWSLTSVSPEGCATIVDNGDNTATVTAVQTGTATLVCTPSTAGYIGKTKNLTITASIKHTALKAGDYYIAATDGTTFIANSLLPRPTAAVTKNPSAVALDFATTNNAWTFSEDESGDDRYDISCNGYYLISTDAAQGVSITDESTAGYWTISKSGTDNFGNAQYHLMYSASSTRYLGWCQGESAGVTTYTYRQYTTSTPGSNQYVEIVLIPKTRTLSGLTVSGTLTKTEYTVGDSFASTGATVKGEYTDNYGGTTKAYLDETSNAGLGWDPSSFTEAGENVKVYAKIGEVKSTNYFTVNVSEDTTPFITFTQKDFTVGKYTGDEYSINVSYGNLTTSIGFTLSPNNAFVSYTFTDNGNGTGIISGTIDKACTNATLTATAGTASDTATFTATQSAVTSITLGISSKIMDVGENYTISATVEGVGNYQHTPAWTSSTPAVATVNASGKVSAIKSGTTTITATAGGESASATITVVRVGAAASYSFTDNCSDLDTPEEVVLFEDTNDMIMATLSIGEGTTAPTYYDNGDALRFYKDNTVKVESTKQNLQKIVFTSPSSGDSSNAITASCGTMSGKTWYAPSSFASEVTFTFSGARRFTTITAYYLDAACFKAEFMHMTDYDPDLDNSKGDGSCETYYPLAKAAYAKLFTADKETFCLEDDYATAFDRLEKWAAANGDKFDNDFNLVSKLAIRSNLLTGGNTSTIVIVIASIVGLTAIGGYFLFKKKKQ